MRTKIAALIGQTHLVARRTSRGKEANMGNGESALTGEDQRKK